MSTTKQATNHPTTMLGFQRTIPEDFIEYILASTSPRRQMVLELMGLKNIVILPSGFPENLDKMNYVTPADYVKATALMKGQAAIQKLDQKEAKNRILIAADTIVACRTEIFEKPKNDEDVRFMLESFSDTKFHQVISAVAIFSNMNSENMKVEELYTQTSIIKFKEITPADIKAYIETGEGRDKAGGFGIQDIGAQFIEGIDGCYYNIIGLPLESLSSKLIKTIKNSKAFAKLPKKIET